MCETFWTPRVHWHMSEIADKLFSERRGSPRIRLTYAKHRVNKDMRLKQAIASKIAIVIRACAHVKVHFVCKLSANTSSTSYFHLHLKCTRLEKNLCTRGWVQMSVLTTHVQLLSIKKAITATTMTTTSSKHNNDNKQKHRQIQIYDIQEHTHTQNNQPVALAFDAASWCHV